MTLVQANELAATNEAPPDLRSVHQLRLRTLRVSVGVLKDNEVAMRSCSTIKERLVDDTSWQSHAEPFSLSSAEHECQTSHNANEHQRCCDSSAQTCRLKILPTTTNSVGCQASSLVPPELVLCDKCCAKAFAAGVLTSRVDFFPQFDAYKAAGNKLLVKKRSKTDLAKHLLFCPDCR